LTSEAYSDILKVSYLIGAKPMEPHFDRFDIAEAYYCISMDFNPSEKIDRRLKSMKFKPAGYLWL
jgi:hypothetical protein